MIKGDEPHHREFLPGFGTLWFQTLVTTMVSLDSLNYVFPGHWNLAVDALCALAVIRCRRDHHANLIGHFDWELMRELRALGVLRGLRMLFTHWSLNANDLSTPANSNGQTR